MARFRSWEPTVAPIWASSPAAWTAVVTISVPFGRPLTAGGGGGGAAGRWAAVAFDCAAAVGDRLAAFFVPVLGTAGFVAATDDLRFGAFVAVAARDLVGAVPRSPPRRVGRVVRRLPRTLVSAPALEFFFDFFLEGFCVMDTVIGRGGRRSL